MSDAVCNIHIMYGYYVHICICYSIIHFGMFLSCLHSMFFCILRLHCLSDWDDVTQETVDSAQRFPAFIGIE